MAARELNGGELAGFVKERQAKQVRMLRQAHQIFPRLVIITSINSSPVIDMYVRLKRRYAEDILIDVDVRACEQTDMIEQITRANRDDSVHGIIVQLPLDDPSQTDQIVAAIAPEKDVDGLGPDANYPSATAEAIDWLLAGYGVDARTKSVVIVGNGRLVGAPLARMWQDRGIELTVLDDTTKHIAPIVADKEIIVTATGVPRLITDDMVASGAVLVDAGTASENGAIVGDVDDAVRARRDVSMTPIRGGVGPLTIAVLIDHVIQAALARID